MEKRVLAAVVLTVCTLAIWVYLFPPPPPPPPDERVVAAPGSDSETEVSRPVAAPGVGAENPEVAVGEAIVAASEETVRIRSSLYDVILSNRGAVAVSWKLESYRAQVAVPGGTSGAVEMVPADLGPGDLRPLSMVTGSPEQDRKLGEALYVVEGVSSELGPDDHAAVTFRWTDGFGNSVEKTLTFDGSSYTVGVDVRASLGALQPHLVLGPGIVAEVQGVTPKELENLEFTQARAAVVRSGGKVHRNLELSLSSEKVALATGGQWPPAEPAWLRLMEASGHAQRYSDVTWAGMEDQYFAVIAYGEEPLSQVVTFPVSAGSKGRPRLAVGIPLSSDGSHVTVYAGPKEAEHLAAARPDLGEAIHYGFFASFSKVLLAALNFFERYVGNYGLAIVILTVLIKLLLLPLSIKQLNTMQNMSRLRPQLKGIEKKYEVTGRDAKQRMEANRAKNAEVMALYQKEGVNPASGCLPLLPQLPIMWGFYSLLSVAIELRHAPFLLWIQDLSAKDPLYVTPFLMLISSFVQQKLTPTSVDAMQQRMLYIMPVVFFFILKDMASGLVLYWLTQNVLQIIQQAWMNRISEQRLVREKAEKRKGKNRQIPGDA